MGDTYDLPLATRRRAFGYGAASFAALASGSARATTGRPARVKLQFDDPVWNREAAARLQADTNGSQVYGHALGVVCAVRPGEAVRTLFDFAVFSTIRVLRQADGSYQRMTKETVLYLDHKTGEVLETWLNPYTNERVKVVPVANDPYNWVIATTFQPPALPGAVNDGQAKPGGKPYLLNWSEFGPDTVVLTEDMHGYYPNRLDPAIWKRESAGKMIQSSELFRWFISRADLENPEMTHVPANGSWVRVQPWMPWMLMGAAPGHIMYDGIFRSSRTLEGYPKPVLDYVRAHLPGYLTAPTRWYGPNYSSLEHYALEQKPAR